ncbi:MAG: hypothetical protein Greene041679_94 [Parcubacteria group bacterium Greene0416_79]|nr:MAG: hypothetical protein Greene041679_94 [Parcubacteria group bacterium Greene0416_79]
MKRGKKILAGLVLGAALIGLALFVAQRGATETVRQEGLTAERVAKVNELLTRDVDRDSLMDWEEELWSTDSANADTDGDGTPDGEEIRLGKNPLVAGPNDPLDQETIRTKVNEPKPEDETRTAEFSRAFFNRYLALRREAGGRLPSDALESLVSGALSDLPETTEAEASAKEDITVSGTGREALRAYGNALGKAITAHSTTTLEDAAEIISRAIETESEEELELLSPHLAAYQRLIAEIRALRAPEEAADAHRAILSGLEAARAGLAGIKALFTDPLNVLPSLKRFEESGEKIQAAFRALQAVFLREKIRFSPEESGYLIAGLGV